MHLKRLEIRGFKSFADSTDIELRPGMNVIVGPNGCGKSNVVDAVRWVLGEGNIRHLRGQKSEDVIFGGTDRKRSLGMAFVEIALDNTDHLLPLDYSEVTISRKVFRSGESEFYINKTRVRMKDVVDLFTGTGLGKKGYSIISQGELEQLLNAQALERRLILEEAGGVSRYRQQREEVSRRMEQNSNDILRLGDLVSELEQRKDELSVKADKARRYMAFSQEYQEREKGILRLELEKIRVEVTRREETLELHNGNLAAAKTELESLESRLEDLERELAATQEELGHCREIRQEMQNQQAFLEGELQLARERIKNNRERIDTAYADGLKFQELMNSLAPEMEANAEEIRQREQQLEEKMQAVTDLEKELAMRQSRMESRSQSFTAKKDEVFDRIDRETRLNNRIIDGEEQHKKLQEKRERLIIRIEESENRLHSLDQQRKLLQEQQKTALSRLKQGEEELAKLSRHKEQQRKQSEDLERALAGLTRDEVEIKNRLAALRDLQERLEGYSPGVKAVLQAARQKRLPGILGVAAQLFQVPEGLETAIEAAVGRGLENIVVDSTQNAERAIAYLKSKGLGRATFLPLDLIRTQLPEGLQKIRTRPGVLGLAAELVEFDSPYTKVVHYLLGRVLVVETLNTGLAAFKGVSFSLKVVTLDGDIINTSGAVTGGSRPGNVRPGLLQRKREEKDLARQLEEKIRLLQENRRLTGVLQEELQSLENSLSCISQQVMEDRFQQELLEQQIKAAHEQLFLEDQDQKRYRQESEQLGREMEQTEQELLGLREEQQRLKQENEAASLELEILKETMEREERETGILNERWGALREQLQTRQRETDSLRKNLSQFEQVRHSYQTSREEAERIRELLENENRHHEEKIMLLETEVQESQVQIAQNSNWMADLKQSLEAKNIERQELQQKLSPRRKNLEEIRTTIRGMELQLARLETEQESALNHWQEKYQSRPQDFPLPELSPIQIKETRQRIRVLQQELESLGPVDISSVEEYQEVEERYTFVLSQYQDLLQARDSLNSLLAETGRLMAKEFAHFLQLASQSFDETFQEIFGGGGARLRMEEGIDRLQAGVDVEVKIPGKRTENLQLLSGGERALTCIALIFALLRLKPSPFCILDEIDASLDETNLLRFNRFLKNMSRGMQFLVITHRQATIETGENIYGVTMPEEGVSSVLTLSLEEAGDLAG